MELDCLVSLLQQLSFEDDLKAPISTSEHTTMIIIIGATIFLEGRAN